MPASAPLIGILWLVLSLAAPLGTDIADGTSLGDLGLTEPVTLRPGDDPIVLPAVFPDGTSQGENGAWYTFELSSSLRFPDDAAVGAKATLSVGINGFAAVQVIYELTGVGVTASGVGWLEGDVVTIGSVREAKLAYENYLQTNGVDPGVAEVSLALRSNEVGAGAVAVVDPASHFAVSHRSPYAVTIEVKAVEIEETIATIHFEVSHNRSDPLLQVAVQVQPLAGVTTVSAPQSLALEGGRGSGTVVVEIDPDREQAELVIGIDAPGFNSPSEAVVLDRRRVDPSLITQWRWLALGTVLLLAGGYLTVGRSGRSSAAKAAAT